MWDASFSCTWVDRFHRKEDNMLAVQCAEADRLFSKIGPTDVGEFAQAVQSAIFGLERLEQWEAERGID